MAYSDTQRDATLDERGNLLGNLIDASKRDRTRFDTVYDILEKYDGSYLNTLRLNEQNWEPGYSYHARTNKTQQYKREVGAMLMNKNPVWECRTKESADPRNVIRGQIMAKLLNTAVSESDFFYDAQRILNDGLGYGRGVLWFGIDDKKGIPVAMPLDPKDFFIDPDAKTWREVRWIGRRRYRSKEELAKIYPTKRGIIYDEPGYGKKSDETYGNAPVDGLDLVEFYEIYMLSGLWNYKGVGELSPSERARLSDTPTRYVVTAANRRVLDEGPWPTPFHRESGRQSWPCEVLDFYPDPKGMWPQSPLEPGIPWLKAMNEIITGMIVKQRRSARKFVAFLRANGVKMDDDVEDKIYQSHDLVEFITFHANIDDGELPDIRKLIQQFSEEYNFAEDLMVYDRFAQEFEKETGLNEFLYFGEANRQDRSAAATNARERNSRKRIDQMAAILDEFFSRVGRKMAIVARFHLDSEDVAKPLSDPEAQQWGTLMQAEAIDPEAIMAQYQEAGASPDTALQVVRSMADDAVDFDEFFQETDYEVQLGSLQRHTPQEKSEKSEIGMNQGYAAALNGGMPLTATMILESWMENTLQVPPEKLQVVRQEAAAMVQRLAAQQTADTQAASAQALASTQAAAQPQVA